MKATLLGAFALLACLCPAFAQDDIRNAEHFTDEEYSRFKKTLIDRPAWEQLQADFLAWKEVYPLRYADSPVIHLIEGAPIVSLQVSDEKLPEIEENRMAGIISFCKLIFKNKRYEEVHISLMNRDHPEFTYTLTITKDRFLEVYRQREISHKLLPSKKQTIEDRAEIFAALQRPSPIEK